MKSPYEQILSDTAIAFKKADTEFWLADGTALTAYRDKKPVDWDMTDLDINVKIEDWTEEVDLVIKKEMFSRGYHKEYLENNPLPYLFQHRYDKDDVHIDIFTWHRVGDYYWRTTHQGGEVYLPYVLPAKYFDNLKLIKYCGVTCKIPEDIENYLALAFGADWNIPLKRGYTRADMLIKKTKRNNRMTDWINGYYDEERYLTERWFQ